MENLESIIDIEKYIQNNEMVLLYFSSNDCNVCHSLLPKVKQMLTKYPLIKSARIEMGEVLEATGKYSIYTIPTILLFVDSKEIIRKARYLSVEELDENIHRYYHMIFDKGE